MPASLGDVSNRPVVLKDANNENCQPPLTAAAQRGDSNGGTNLVYIAYARAGSNDNDPVWQLRKCTYDGNGNVTSVQYPINSSGSVSNDYEFIWANRSSYTYQ